MTDLEPGNGIPYLVDSLSKAHSIATHTYGERPFLMLQVNSSGSMQYRALGKTGILVSEIGFGSHLLRENVENAEERCRHIHKGIEKGINLFDIYEHSHKQFAPMSRALDPVRNEVLLSLVTVWREVHEVMDEVDYALKMFKRDTIDLFRVVLSKRDWDDSEQRLTTLAKAKEQGKVRAIGGVVHYPEHFLEGLRRFPDLLEYMMAPVSMFAPLVIREDRELAHALRAGDLGFMAIKALGAYRDGEANIRKLHPEGDEVEALEAKGLTIGKLAIKYLLQSDRVSTVVPTMNSIDEVLDDVSASGDGPLTEDEERFIQIYREEGERTFSEIIPEDNYWINPWKV
jgi:aryl-alcohol dehydrogenase-like predicted oxidoreductase